MMGGRRIRFKLLDGTRFDDDEIEVHGGDCLEAFCWCFVLVLASRRIMALISEQRRDQYEKSMNQGEKLLM